VRLRTNRSHRRESLQPPPPAVTAHGDVHQLGDDPAEGHRQGADGSPGGRQKAAKRQLHDSSLGSDTPVIKPSLTKRVSKHELDILARKVRKGLVLSFLNNAVGRLGTLLAGIVLARLLTPQDYGVFAVSLVALNAMFSLFDLGVHMAIVRWPGDPKKIAPTVSTLATVGSLLCYGVCWVLTPWFATELNAPSSIGIIRLLGLAVVAAGISAVPVGLLDKSFQQGRRMIGELLSFGASTGTTIALAAAGAGAWSLAWGRVVGNVLATVAFFLLARARWQLGFDSGLARQLLGFGLPLAGAQVLAFAMLNLDYMVVGRMLGPVALGFYLLAFNLSSWPVNMFSVAVRRVTPAGFSRLIEDPLKLNTSFTRSMSLLAAATIPVCVLLAVLALPAIRLVYGNRWTPAAEALRFLALLGAVRVATELVYDFLVAVGRTRANFFIQTAWVLALLPALILGAQFGGVMGVGLGHAAVAVFVIIPACLLAVRQSGIRIGGIARGVIRPAMGGALAAVAATTTSKMIDGDLAMIVVAGGLALGIHIAVVAPLHRLMPSARVVRSVASRMTRASATGRNNQRS
jgi:O-antigen/teichoic acid export membrane protein